MKIKLHDSEMKLSNEERYRRGQRILIALIILLMLITIGGYLGCNYIANSFEASVEDFVEQIASNKQNEKLKSDDNLNKESLEIINEPSVELTDLTDLMSEQNWVADHNRLKDTPIYLELDRDKKVLYNNRPFYSLSYTESRISRTLVKNIDEDFFNTTGNEIFDRVDNIWAYFYRDETAKGTIPDGIIEQWEFATTGDALIAKQRLSQIDKIVYFNTIPYHHTHRNRLYIFHTRAMAFSFKQEEVYNQFMNEVLTND